MGLRSRNIKVGFWDNENIGKMSLSQRLLFIGLWCAADRDGKLEDRPERLRKQLFGFDSKTPDVHGDLTVIERLGFIQRYKAAGQPYILVLNFNDHQSPHHTEIASKIPDPQCPPYAHGELTVNSPLFTGEIPLIPDSLIPDSLIPDSEDSLNDKPMPSKPEAPLPQMLSETLKQMHRVRLSNPGELYAAWKAAYPDVDICKSFRECEAWAVTKRATRSEKGWAKTLNTWLKKEQDNARPNREDQKRELVR